MSHINVHHLLKTLGVTLVSVEESPITFPNLEMISLYENVEGFSKIMMTHMMDTFKINLAKIVGNLDIMGNPVSLFSNIAGGFKQVYE